MEAEENPPGESCVKIKEIQCLEGRTMTGRRAQVVATGAAIAIAVAGITFFAVKGAVAQPPPPGPGVGAPLPPGQVPGPVRPPMVGQMPMMMGMTALAANDRYVYVLRGGLLLQFDAGTLELVKKVDLRELLPGMRQRGRQVERERPRRQERAGRRVRRAGKEGK